MSRLAAVVPALNEAESIGDVVSGLHASGACCVLVVDGGSSDGTCGRASASGAVVIHEPRRGYGRACLTGAEAAQAAHHHDLIAFLDGDGSCDPRELGLLAAHAGRAEVVLGIRRRETVERGAYPWHARAGNFVATTVIRLRSGTRVRDLSPFKVLRAPALARLQLRQQGYAWTAELVARACSDRSLVTVEAPISFRARRGGASKVSGRLLPSIKAGLQILRAAVTETSPRPRLFLMAKSPARAKSRLAAEAGDDVASGFWAASISDTGAHLLRAAAEEALEARLMVSASDEIGEMTELLGPAWIVDVQNRPGLSEALVDVFASSFAAGAPLAMAVSGDNPTLPPPLVHLAVESLRRFDAVLGPTLDGGYYLIGIKRSAFTRRYGHREARQTTVLRRIFDSHVSGGSARQATQQAIVEAGLSVATLESWADVDTISDLRQLARNLVQAPEAAPATAAWLLKEAPWLLPTAAAGAVSDLQAIRSVLGGSDVQQ